MQKNVIVRYSIKTVKRVVPLALALYFAPAITVVFILLGLIDASRNRPLNLSLLNRYFFGTGVLTWFASPLNLLIDLICMPFRNLGVYKLENLPDEYRKEILTTIQTLINDPDLIGKMKELSKPEDRAMVFFRWYGKPVESSVKVPNFNRNLKFLPTVGVSAFNAHRSTGLHFGPIRSTIRVLYNLNRIESDDVFIEVQNRKHVWRDEPLFIFDDTLLHRSVNESDEMRFCIFMDIIRPSYFPAAMRAIVSITHFIFYRVNFLFYKNWTFLR